MAIRLISYDLIQPGRDYKSLHDAIRALGRWWHCLESVWLVKTDLSCVDVRDQLKAHIDANDRLAVFTVVADWATYNLSKQCTDYLHEEL